MADMTSIARPYAKAAFEFALEHQQIVAWSEFLGQLSLFINEPVCAAFLANPTVSSEQQGQMLLAVVEKFKIGSDIAQAKQFVELLAHNKRLLVIPTISKLYQDLRASYERTLAVDVCSFSSLSKEQIVRLSERLSQRLQRQVTLSVSIDPELLGGAIIRAGDLVFDGSVRTQIKKLSTNLAA